MSYRRVKTFGGTRGGPIRDEKVFLTLEIAFTSFSPNKVLFEGCRTYFWKYNGKLTII